MNEYQRMFEEDRALMCPKCLGNGILASSQTFKLGPLHQVEHKIYECDACDGSGVRKTPPAAS